MQILTSFIISLFEGRHRRIRGRGNMLASVRYPSLHLSVCPSSVNTYFAWLDISALLEGFERNLAQVFFVCELTLLKRFLRSKVKVVIRPNALMTGDRGMHFHGVLLRLTYVFLNSCTYTSQSWLETTVVDVWFLKRNVLVLNVRFDRNAGVQERLASVSVNVINVVPWSIS